MDTIPPKTKIPDRSFSFASIGFMDIISV